MSNETRSVFVAITGRPNVGKSSLLNRLVGEKAAIVTPKPQTTRTRITGILTQGPVQYVFLDTPGIHKPKNSLGKQMERTTAGVVAEGDVTLMLFDPVAPLRPVETEMINALGQGGHAIAAINKVDTISDLPTLAAKRDELEAFGVFKQIHAISALTGDGCEGLLEDLSHYASPGPHFFADDIYTDQPEKQLVAEIVREKLLLHLQEEIPHGTAVEVERFHEREGGCVIDIDVTIYCERKTHKGMIIGKGGAMLKQIAMEARQDCEAFLGAKVFLQCWVKVREGWRGNDNMVNRMGFGR
ncbi:MAG: GTPase Era [Ruminococcaceae bacterium]|nr:GTPase Era [Oscillospiraceae bacterium]